MAYNLQNQTWALLIYLQCFQAWCNLEALFNHFCATNFSLWKWHSIGIFASETHSEFGVTEMSFLTTRSTSNGNSEYLSVGLIASKREIDKWDVLIISRSCYSFLGGVCSASPFGVAFLREQEMQSLYETTGMPVRALGPNAQMGIQGTCKLLSPPSSGDIMLIISTMSFFSPLALLPSAWK